MSNIQEELNEKLKNAKKNFMDSICNLDKQIFDKIESIKEDCDLKIKELNIKKESNTHFSDNDTHKIAELEEELKKIKEEKEKIASIVQEKEEKINNLKDKMESFMDKIFQKIEEVENLMKN